MVTGIRSPETQRRSRPSSPDRWQEEIDFRMHDLIDEIDWCMGPEAAKRLSDFAFTSGGQDKIEDRARALIQETQRHFEDAKRQPHRCRVTGAKTFKDALAKILADPQMVQQVLIRVDRGTKEANIEFTPGPKSEHSRTRFVSGRDGERRKSGLEVTATIRILGLPKFALGPKERRRSERWRRLKRQCVTPSGEEREAWIVDFNLVPSLRCELLVVAKLQCCINHNSLAGSRSHAQPGPSARPASGE